ncbi:MAG TPA: hypothetical protein VGJ82_05650 [Thermoanaerobaculia bacterium]|jgi:hypothetical protein
MRSTVAVSFLVCLLAAFPAASATKRAVKPIPLVFFNYTLFDTTTQQPVIGAEVRSGSQSTTTDVSGNFSLQVPPGRPTAVTVHRTGYDDLTFTVVVPLNEDSIPVSFPLPKPPVITFPNGAPPQTVTTGIALQSQTPVIVRLTSGQTLHLDADSVQFAYVLPFETPQGANNASFCMASGIVWAPDRSEFSQIIGPAVSLQNAVCCKLGPLLAVSVKMKGTNLPIQVAFSDSCFGYDIDFVGRDHESAQYVYLNFKDVALITFP